MDIQTTWRSEREPATGEISARYALRAQLVSISAIKKLQAEVLRACKEVLASLQAALRDLCAVVGSADPSEFTRICYDLTIRQREAPRQSAARSLFLLPRGIGLIL